MSTTLQQSEAIARATNGGSFRNDAIVIAQFKRRGIAANPRVDVFTYAAWQGQGRQVRKGEHGVKLQTWIPITDKADKADKAGRTKTRRRMAPKSATVFHISQTDPS